MIPIVSAANGISFLVSFAITAHLFSSYLKSSNPNVRYFFWCFFSMTAFFFTISMPGIITRDPFVAAVFNAISLPLMMIAAALFAIIPMNLLHRNIFRVYYIAAMAITIVFTFLLRFLHLDPLQIKIVGNFTYWIRQPNPYMQISFLITGIVVLLSTGIAGIFFLLYARKNRQDRYALVRSVLLGSGAFLLGLTAGMNYIVGATPNPLLLLASSLLAIFSLLVLSLGIFYRGSQGKI